MALASAPQTTPAPVLFNGGAGVASALPATSAATLDPANGNYHRDIDSALSDTRDPVSAIVAYTINIVLTAARDLSDTRSVFAVLAIIFGPPPQIASPFVLTGSVIAALTSLSTSLSTAVPIGVGQYLASDAQAIEVGLRWRTAPAVRPTKLLLRESAAVRPGGQAGVGVGRQLPRARRRSGARKRTKTRCA